ncbi:glycine cleavage system aminomethyltransferase GcvT [Oceanibaculum sp.]|uniref:glycine cleavage system aminomethyltransferase GcvT n=1 Tax=Oceanibaculum sp. TaxID=1903597 RepID=UPI00258C7B9D|nr:glycine cleavage system aminomethyltransferase GcvT [Oceanibaculum sp.]MCH2395623.1 glycine cleavage system aminomethyltransferase GcvT [Oceanibaculum sp.]
MSADTLLTTPLNALHRELGGKMVEFAGYEMPVQYPAGIMAEHLHTRDKAGLFDVSHMGQVKLSGEGADKALEMLVPGEIQALKPGRQRYTLFTNEQGGILDDLMVTRFNDHLFLVVNAACKTQDIEHMRAHLPSGVTLEVMFERALMALQGPAAKAVMARLGPAACELTFMGGARVEIGGIWCTVTRSGYTGEDGFEISVDEDKADKLARLLLDQPEVMPIGLGARDSLRLEAGLCLYGHDIDTGTTPIEADLAWAIGKRRREEGGFPGADIILDQLKNGTARKRVGIRPEGRAPAREHTELTDAEGRRIGEITSGGFGPSVGGPVAMGYVETAFASEGTDINAMVRGKALPAKVASMPFTPHRYHRG